MSSRKDGFRADGDGGSQATMNKIRNTEPESNMTEILGIIEQKTNGMIAKYVVISTTESNKPSPPPQQVNDAMAGANHQLGYKQAEAASLQPLVTTLYQRLL